MDLDRLERLVHSDSDYIIFLSTRDDEPYNQNICFYDPIDFIIADDTVSVGCLREIIELNLKKGYYVAGYVSYEAGYFFEEKLSRYIPSDKTPVIMFGVFDKYFSIDNPKNEVLKWMVSFNEPYDIGSISQNITKGEYLNNVLKIKDYISAGDTYQVNYTYKHKFSFSGNPFSLFCDLHNRQPVGYSVFVNFNGKSVISLSPELFFSKNSDIIKVKPMKGTIGRGKNIHLDAIQENELRFCEKNRAENTMIVDLLRNDLGRICQTGSVNVDSLFDVTRYRTLFQMTSTISGKLNKDISIYDILSNIFPSGSITGAPKIRAMQIINELEPEPRGVYTGSIGYITPDGDSIFNVAIRTIVVDKAASIAEMGVGSGIVADSDADKEYNECSLKTDFLFKQEKPFKLIETILWDASGFFLLDFHIDRLEKSALRFEFCFDKDGLINLLKNISGKFNKLKKYKLRLLMDKYGVFEWFVDEIMSENAGNVSKKKYIAISGNKVCSSDIFLFHKTTNRGLYDSEFKRALNLGFYDTIFLNEKDELTEGAISNIFIKKGDFYYTPPIDCGILDGVFRKYFMERNSSSVIEKILYIDDLKNADSIYLCNSVRGLVEVFLRDNNHDNALAGKHGNMNDEKSIY